MAATSALTGPGTRPQISATTSRILRPDLAISEGLVVTPSSRPLAASDLISAVSAVSTKNFMRLVRIGATPDGQARKRSGLYRMVGVDRKLRSRVPVMLPYPFPGPFDYRVPPELDVAPGDVVLVPLNRREEVGVVWDAPGDATVPDRKLKPIAAVLDTPAMAEPMRRFIDWIAAYTLTPPGEVMAMALRVVRPDAARPPTGWLVADPPPDVRITDARPRVL